jgi:malate dehydrogenase
VQSQDILNDKEKRDALINRIQFGGDEVVKAKGQLPPTE